jgi:hypothetical protein
MIIQQLTTEINFPSSTELMLGAVSGTVAGIALLVWIDHHINRSNRNKGQNHGITKRT